MHQTADEVGHIRQLAQTALSSERVLQGQDTMIDQDARDSANDAKAQISSHEKLCAERWDTQKKSSERTEASVSKLETTLADGLKTMSEKIDRQVAKTPATIIAFLTLLVGLLAGMKLH